MTLALLRTITLAFLGACAVTLVLIDQDPRSHAYLVVTVRSLLQQSLKAPTQVVFKSLRLGLGKAGIGPVHIAVHDEAWSWDTETLELHFSLLQVMRHRNLSLRAVLKNSEVMSRVDKEGIAIVPAIKRLFSAGNTNQSISVYHATIVNNKVSLVHPMGTCSALMAADLPLVGRSRTSYVWWYNGSLTYDHCNMIDTSEGLYRHDHEQGKTCVDHTAIVLPFHPASQLFESAALGEKGVWNVHTQCAGSPTRESPSVDITINNDAGTISGACHMPLAWLYSAAANVPVAPCTGIVDGEFHGQLHDLFNTFHASCSLREGTWRNNSLPACTATLDNAAEGALINVDFSGLIKLATCIKSIGHDYAIDVRVADDMLLASDIQVKSGSSLHITTNKRGVYTGSYSLACQTKNAFESIYSGTLRGSPADVVLSGSVGQYTFSLGASTDGVPHITHVALSDGEQAPLLQLKEDNGVLKGSCDVRSISLCAGNKMGPLMLGEGMCTFEGIISTKELDAIVTLTAGSTIRIPYLYNILEELSMHVYIDWASKIFRANDVVLKLHRGTMLLSQIKGAWKDNTLASLTLSYIAQNCLMSWRKNLFALLSGGGTLSYTPAESYVTGFLIVEKGHMRNNILSTELTSQGALHAFSSESHKSSVNFDVTLMTRKPIQVKTSFLETHVRAHAHLRGTLEHPLLEGDVVMLEGSLLFPYKPLFIRQGKVSLRPSQTNFANNLMGNVLKYSNVGYEPSVNLIAENTIKGYRVRLHAQGPLQNPELTFSATPHLPPEQIIALLFAGSEDGSIYVAMSTYVMQSIKQLLFGPTDGSSTILQSLNNLFRPLGSVRFVPSFTDQSSRGGIRGSLTLEVNERLRGMIKQNFDLPQDVMLEVEYDLSDDARIRAIKDERGDLGAEIEASWKF